MNTLFGVIFALFFLLLGIIGIILPWSPVVRTEVVDFLLSNTVILMLFGFSFFVIGIGALFQVLHGMKRSYTTFKEGHTRVDVSEEVIQDYLLTYFHDLFPYTEVPCQILFNKKKIQIIADLPFVAHAKQKELLKKIESDLSDLFRDILGYRHDLYVSISFAGSEKQALA